MKNSVYSSSPHLAGSFAKNNTTNKQEAIDNLTKTLGNANDILFRATTVFPFTMFPDT